MVLVFLQVCYGFCGCSDHKVPWVLSDSPDQIFLQIVLILVHVSKDARFFRNISITLQ